MVLQNENANHHKLLIRRSSQKVTHCVTNLHLTKNQCIVRIPVDESKLEQFAEYSDADPSRVLTLEEILDSLS